MSIKKMMSSFSLLCDYRETAVISMFKKLDVPIKIEPLEPCDFWIVDQYNHPKLCLERKTLQDMNASIFDGRMKNQGLKMELLEKQHSVKCMYILETSTLQLPDRITTTIRRNCIYKNRPTLFTNSVAGTVELLSKLLTDSNERGLHAPDVNVEQSHINTKSFCKKIKCEPDQLWQFMLSHIPQCGKATTKAIVDKYNSPQQLCEAYRQLTPEERPNFLHNTIKIDNKRFSQPLSQKIAYTFGNWPLI